MGRPGESGGGSADAHLGAVLDVLEEGVLSFDGDDRVVAVNESALRILGLTRADLERPRWWRHLRLRDEHGAAPPDPIPAREDVRVRLTRASDGRTRHVVLRREPLPGGGSVISLRDRTDARRTREQLDALGLRDATTGLPNRTAALAMVGDALAAGEPFALLLVDVDGFQAVNVGLGQVAGDAVLRELAGRLRAVAPRAARVARFGGDDFLVLAPASGIRRARATAERVQDAFVAPFAAGDGAHLTASIGVAASDAAADTAGLVSAAEAALALARSRGRGLLAVFDDALRRSVDDRLALVADLRDAIDRDGLRIAYQPIVALGEGPACIRGVEALSRWTHPRRGEVSPTTFVPLAEDAGLVRALGRRVLARACLEIARLRTEVPGAEEVRLSVNISARQVASGLLEHDVRAALTASGLPPAALALELTESALMEDSAPALDGLARLRELGVRLLIDDFGTGYSSLTRLRELPVDGLKVDRSFVAGLGRAPVDSAIVEAVLTMARALELPVVAEGVERDEQAARLRALGCPAAQGFLLGRPMPLDDLRARFDRQQRTLRAMGAER